MADRLSSSRIGRAARIGGLAAGAAGRSISGRATTVGRSEEAKAEANRKAVLETAERMVTVLGSMRGAAMKIGQTLSVIDIGAGRRGAVARSSRPSWPGSSTWRPPWSSPTCAR